MIARRISVMRTGRVWGDLQLEKLATEEGCFVQGKVTMQETVDLNAYLPAKSQSKDSSDSDSKPEESPAAVSTAKVSQISKRQG
jgi:cytoskeletal protein CcmA (bactofilin family)